MKPPFLLLLVLAFVSGCVTWDKAVEAKRPLEFFVSAGHPWTGQRSLSWQNDRLVMRKSGVESEGGQAIEKTFAPSAGKWQRFLKQMDSLGVWQWRSNYEPNGQVIETDGPVWKVSIKFDEGRRVDSIGRTVFPPDEVLIWRSEGYIKLCLAIDELILEKFCS